MYDPCGMAFMNVADTLRGFIDRDYSHPCIITWVPLNESWGVPQIMREPRQQAAARMLYQLTKALDGTRLCSGNDGWEQADTDICALHDYADRAETLQVHFASREEVDRHGCDVKPCYVDSQQPDDGTAFMVTEYGGIAFSTHGAQGSMGGMDTWGYHDKVSDEESFLARYRAVTDAIRAIPYCQGYCYTQLTDVMQEVNGLLSPDRTPKVAPEKIAQINRSPEGR